MLTSWFFQYLHVEEYIYEISGEVIKVVVAREIQPLKRAPTLFNIGAARMIAFKGSKSMKNIIFTIPKTSNLFTESNIRHRNTLS